jgi:5-methylcytosine-specific restriction endonuclease McrA
MIDPEFIQRAEKFAEPLWNEFREERKLKIYKWNRENRELLRKLIRKYSYTEKGRYACSKRNATRRNKFKSSCDNLTWEERRLIGRFYKNCPKGYEVDHIIPVSKDGKHKLSNLQYLTKEENRRKSNKILSK